jgi:hypothetical protein
MRLSALRSAMNAYATRFDPSRVSAQDAARVVEDAAAIEKMAATVKSIAAARVAETNLWKSDGDLSAAHHLARTTGIPVGQARDAQGTRRPAGTHDGQTSSSRSAPRSAVTERSRAELPMSPMRQALPANSPSPPPTSMP